MNTLLIDNISCSDELCNELAILKKKEEKLQAQLDDLQEKCGHPIIIVAMVDFGYAVNAKCLFCNKHYNTPHELRKIPNYIALDAWAYKKLKDVYFDKEIYSIITSKAKEFLQENPTIDSKQLAQNLNAFFK